MPMYEVTHTVNVREERKTTVQAKSSAHALQLAQTNFDYDHDVTYEPALQSPACSDGRWRIKNLDGNEREQAYDDNSDLPHSAQIKALVQELAGVVPGELTDAEARTVLCGFRDAAREACGLPDIPEENQ